MLLYTCLRIRIERERKRLSVLRGWAKGGRGRIQRAEVRSHRRLERRRANDPIFDPVFDDPAASPQSAEDEFRDADGPAEAYAAHPRRDDDGSNDGPRCVRKDDERERKREKNARRSMEKARV